MEKWKILDREIAVRKPLINEIVDVRMIVDGQMVKRELPLRKPERIFWLFFDDKPVRIWPKQAMSQETTIPEKDLN